MIVPLDPTAANPAPTLNSAAPVATGTPGSTNPFEAAPTSIPASTGPFYLPRWLIYGGGGLLLGWMIWK